MRAPNAPLVPQIRLHPDAAAVEVQALFRGVVIGSRCLAPGDVGPFLIGSAKGVDAPAAAQFIGGEAHPLVSVDERGFAVGLTEQMTGTVIFEDRTANLQELLRTQGASFLPPPATRFQIACGEVAFLIGTTAAPPEIPRPPLARLRDHWALLLSGVATLLLLAVVSFLPPDPQSLSGDTIDATRRWIQTVTVPTIEPATPAGTPSPTTGPVAAGSGNRVDRAPRPSPRPRAARPRGTPTQIDPGSMGILQVLQSSEGKGWEAILKGDGALDGTGIDQLVDGGAPTGLGSGIGLGPFGTGADRTGPLVGSGPDGRIGACGPACRERILQHARNDRWRPHKTITPQVGTGQVLVRGGLDKEIVRRVIRRHLNEVKYCYEQQLPRHPNLAGRITVQFTITAAGSVATSMVAATTINNVAVESCVAQAVRRWEFPKTDGVAVVSYPFVLVPAGSS